MEERRVLIPLDGSRLAESSLEFARMLARFEPIQILLMAVIDELEVGVRALVAPRDVESREQNVMNVYLDEVAAKLQTPGVEVITEVREGSPAQLILERASTFQPHVLIVSTRGRSGWTRWRVGSVADKVIRGASCPTLVVGPRAEEAEEGGAAGSEPSVRRILVPLDGSPISEQALDHAVEYARLFDAEVHFLRVVQTPSTSDWFVDVASDQRVQEMMIKEARQYLAGVADRTATPHDVQMDVMVGSPADVILSYIATSNIDLVVMTSHGRGGLVRATFGSVTDRLIGGAAPLIVVHARSL